MERSRKFRELIDAPGLLRMPGVYDALSARIVEAEGFDALVAGGNAGIGSTLGEADMGQSNVRDYADHYARIAGAVEIPVYVDADTGFGSVHNVRQMVRAFESAGVAGLLFSDQVFPNRCGYLPGKQIAPVEEMLARVAAALDARRDPDFVIVGRTDVYSVEGLDAAIERCQLFMEIGADYAKPQGVDRLEEIRRVVAEVPCPHIGNLSQAAGAAQVTIAAIEDAGVAAVTFPTIGLLAAAHAVREVMGQLRKAASLDEVVQELLPLEDYYELVGLEEMFDREKRYEAAGLELADSRQAPRAT